MMKAGPKELKKDEILFREGDASDSAFVVKSGRLAITKSKGNSDIILAELGPGSMLGEMAFFDNKPRSAGAKALSESVVIALPFAALNAQFKTFPEWLKVMVRTINEHLRDANKRIKNLEQAQAESDRIFSPHIITRLTAILTLVASKFGEKEADGINVPTGTLRRYTIQIFQQPTNKMQKLNEVLSSLGYVEVKDLGEGKQKLVVKNLELLSNFVTYYNDYLFKEESKRVTIEQKDLPVIRALLYYAQKTKKAKNIAESTVTISLTGMQNESMRDLNYLVRVESVDSLIEKKICGDKMSVEGSIMSTVNITEVAPLIDYWTIVYALLNYSE